MSTDRGRGGGTEGEATRDARSLHARRGLDCCAVLLRCAAALRLLHAASSRLVLFDGRDGSVLDELLEGGLDGRAVGERA